VINELGLLLDQDRQITSYTSDSSIGKGQAQTRSEAISRNDSLLWFAAEHSAHP
jgi:hypothetical protein